MRLLLDTHALLWFLAGDEKLSGVARALVEDDGNEVLVSAGSLWEIAIKLSLRKLGMSIPFEEAFPAQLDANEIRILPILPAHLQRVVSLPFVKGRSTTATIARIQDAAAQPKRPAGRA